MCVDKDRRSPAVANHKAWFVPRTRKKSSQINKEVMNGALENEFAGGFQLSFFNKKTDNDPKLRTKTWSDVCQWFENPLIRLEQDGPLFSPARFKSCRRANSNVESVSLAIFDIDHNADVHQIHEKLDTLGCCYIVGSTHSHLRNVGSNLGAEPRYRIVIGLSTPIPGKLFDAVWKAIRKKLALNVDESAKDASRMYYVPAKASESDPYYFKSKNGPPFDWTHLDYSTGQTERSNLAPALSNVTGNGSRNAAMASMAGTLRRRNAEPESIVAVLKLENAAKCNPPLPDDELIKIANSIDRYEPSKSNNMVAEQASMFTIKPANQWIKESRELPMPRKLFGDLWLEGEIVLLFSDTGLGKTIFGVQAADIITCGKRSQLLGSHAEPQRVLYFDFELSQKQFESRYSCEGGGINFDPYAFSQNFLRCEINPDTFDLETSSTFEQYILIEVEKAFVDTGAMIGIIDNITYLGKGTETAKDALPLMKGLNRLKKKLGLSLMVLTHTPKRDMSRPLSVNDMTGSKMLSNFADSVIAIGASARDQNTRYVKQVKVRSSEIIYGPENVLLVEVSKPANFLMFGILGFGCEREHLKGLTDQTRSQLIQNAKGLSDQGISQREIAKRLEISVGAVNKYLNKSRS